MNVTFHHNLPNLESSSRCFPSAGSHSIHQSKSVGMMECQGLVEGETVMVNSEDGKKGEGNSREAEVDKFIEKMGFTVSGNKGKDVKLSKYLRVLEGGGNGKKGDKRARELRKLAWDMNDGNEVDMEAKSKITGRVSSKVKQ